MNGDEKQQQAVPVIEEELLTGTRAVKTGSVRVRKEVERRLETVEMPLARDVVSVHRVPVNREVSEPPPMREEGDTLIVSVVEEEIVVQKRLVVTEEIHIQRSQTRENVRQEVTVGRERATVERLDGDGNVTATSLPSTTPEASRSGTQPQRRLIRRRGSHE